MNLRLRGAGSRDLKWLDNLIKEYKFNLEPSHIESIVVVEDMDSGNLIAAGSLVTILESMFVTDKKQPRKARLEALKMILVQAEKEVKECHYDSYHAFATNSEIDRVLQRKFNFQPTNAKVLVKFID